MKHHLKLRQLFYSKAVLRSSARPGGVIWLNIFVYSPSTLSKAMLTKESTVCSVGLQKGRAVTWWSSLTSKPARTIGLEPGYLNFVVYWSLICPTKNPRPVVAVQH